MGPNLLRLIFLGTTLNISLGLNFNQPELIPDGVLVTGGEETRSHAATWTVLVTLDAPKREPGLKENLNILKRVINQAHSLLKTQSNVTRQV